MPETLQNIKSKIGSLPLGNNVKAEISFSVTTYFIDTTLGPALIAPAALPPLLQTKLPCWIFGLTDYYSLYAKGELLTPLLRSDSNSIAAFSRWLRFIQTAGFGAAWATSAIYGFTPVPVNPIFLTLIPQIQIGDLIHCFLCPPVAVSQYYAMILIHCNEMPYGTFLNSFVSDLITINRMKMIIPAEGPAANQYENYLRFSYQDLLGLTITDTLDPKMFITSRTIQRQICDIPLEIPLDKDFLLSFYIDVFCQRIDFTLYVSKTEQLTYTE